MNTSKRHAIEVDLAAAAEDAAAEFVHAMWERHLNEQSATMLNCYSGLYLDGETLLCTCRLCAPQPEPGCYCPVCMLYR